MSLIGMRASLRELTRVPSRTSAKGASAIEKLWRKNYRAGLDPYGNAWAKLRPSTIARKGHGRIMIETGETLQQTRARTLPGGGIALRTGPKAAWHMDATANRPARRVMPAFGLPTTWRAKLRDIADREFKRAVRK